MTSKNLFFKLSFEDLKGRLWTFALIMLTFLFQFPVAVVYLAGERKDSYQEMARWLEWYEREIMDLIKPGNGFLCFLIIIIAVVCGMTSFSYLNSKSKVDFFHSIPVRREKIYLANFLNGIWLVAVPYALMLMAGIGLASANGLGFFPLFSEGAKGYALHMTYYLLTYSTVVVVMMLTGNRVVGFMGICVFFSYIPSAIAVVEGCFYTWFHTYCGNESWIRSILVEFSPIVAYVDSVTSYEYDGIGIVRLAVALAASAVLAVIGLVLYKKRPSEAAGKALAFRHSKPVIRILIVMLCSICMMAFGWNLRENLGWAVFCMLCGCIISHCVIEIIYNFDFKKLFNHKFQLLGCIAVSVLLLCIFRYDLFGYDRYLPKAEQVESISINFGSVDNWVDYGHVRADEDGSYGWEWESVSSYTDENMRITDTEPVLAIAEAGIARIQQEEKNGGIIDEEGSLYSDIYIRYRMKGGKEVKRRYYLPLSSVDDDFRRVYQSREFQEGYFPLLLQSEEDTAYISYKKSKNQGKESRLTELSQEVTSEILKTYKEEWMNIDIRNRREESPVGLIRFVTKDTAEAIAWADRRRLTNGSYSSYGIYDGEYYPVFPSFEKTLKLLEEHGADIKDTLTGFHVDSITLTDRTTSRSRNIIIRDPDEIEEIMKHAVLEEYSEYNSFLEVDYNRELSVTFVNQGIKQEHCYLFIEGQVPDFIKQKIGD